MTTAAWRIVETAALLLEPGEREVALGDLTEANEGSLRALREVLGLAVRRQANVWKSWKPWVAGFGLALPASFLLMGASVSVSSTYERLFDARNFGACAWTGNEGYGLLLCHVLLLAGWSWTSGFVLGTLSRRTLWASILLAVLPCLFCFVRFRIAFLSKYSLFLFVAPGIVGLWRALRGVKVKSSLALLLAGSVTVLMMVAESKEALWILNWALVWPAWYLVAEAKTRTLKSAGCRVRK